MKRIFLSLSKLIASIAIILLTGCTNMAVTGAQAIYNRHDLKQALNDHYISLKAEHTIYNKKEEFHDTNINVAAFNNVVLLTGQVRDPSQKQEAEQVVRDIAGDAELHNLLAVSSPISSSTHLSDSWITAKIKARFLASEEIDPTQFKIITENSTVYLMGIVPPQQASAAVEIARTTDGVENVVKVLSYLRISKT